MDRDSQKLPGRKRTGGRQRGQSMVEFALVVPVFLILVFGIIDFGLGLRAWISITNAAREGARVGAVRGSCSEIEAQVMNTSGGLVTSASQIDIDPDCDGLAGDDIAVTVSYEYELITPLGGMLSILGGVGLPASFDIESTSHMRVE
jgi:hypothetical protein